MRSEVRTERWSVMSLRILCGVLFALTGFCSFAAAQEKLPPALTEYKGCAIAQTMHYAGAPWLTRESRDREEDCNKLIAELKLTPGMTICDMGCGNGFYTLRIAKRLGPAGTVYAGDI